MRKLLLTFLVLVMLTPSLVCAMPYCEPALQDGAVSSQQPCAEHVGNKKTQDIDKGTLMADCIGVEFQKAESVTVDTPNLKVISAVYNDIYGHTIFEIDLIKGGSIRAPPDDAFAHLYQIPTLLKTQRIRL